MIRQKVDPLIGVRCFTLDESDDQVPFFAEWLMSQWLHLFDFSPLCISRDVLVNWPRDILAWTKVKFHFPLQCNLKIHVNLGFDLLNLSSLGCHKNAMILVKFLDPRP